MPRFLTTKYLSLIIIIITFSLSSCTREIQSFRIEIPKYYAKFIAEKHDKNIQELENINNGKALLYPLMDESGNFIQTEQFNEEIEKYLFKVGLFQTVTNLDKMSESFSSELKQEKNQYLDLYRFSKISIREYTRKLYNEFDLDYSVFFQINFWPCKGCINLNYINMNMSVVDNYSGYLVWMGVGEDIIGYNNSSLIQEGESIRDELLTRFHNSFKPLPHIQFAQALEQKAGD